MPNYVMNRLQLIGDPDKVKEVLDFVRSSDGNQQMDFNKIVPIPPHIYCGNLGQEHRDLFGEDTWYEWCPKYWGTKWNAICAEDAEKCTDDTIYFQTAWNGVPKLIYLLSSKFNDVKFVYEFADEGIGYNCGIYMLENGNNQYGLKMPINESRYAFDIAQSLWKREDYYWDEENQKIAYKED